MKKLKHFKNLLLAAFLLAAFGLSAQHWSLSGPHIYNNNPGFVGVGIANPNNLLHAASNMVGAQMIIQNLGGTGGAGFTMIDGLSTAHWKFKATTFGGFKIRDQFAGSDVFTVEQGSPGNSIYIDAAGDAAFGHTAPDGHQLNALSYTAGKAAVQGLDQSGPNTYAVGMLAILNPNLTGAPSPVSLSNSGVLGIATSQAGTTASVHGWNNGTQANNFAGLFMADGAATASGETNYGVYADARGGNQNFAGSFHGRVDIDGHPDAATAADYTSTVLTVDVNHTGTTGTYAIHGTSNPSDGNGYGVVGTGGYRGVYGVVDAGTGGFGYGVFGQANGTTGRMIGVYGVASGGTTNWAGYFVGDAYVSSDLRIATTTQATGYALSVNGKVACEEVLVQDLASWPDYVFAEEYELMDLKELEKSIEKNNHLPGLPPAAEVEKNGFELADMQRRVLEKVEELTLYTIEQGKLIEELQHKVETLEKENVKLKRAVK